MSPPNFKPGSPEDWLVRSKSNLVRARNLPQEPGFLILDACFDAQQAAEKAVKAVLVHFNINFPYTHNLTDLLNLLLKAGHTIPDEVLQAGRLTEYAVEARYPPSLEKVTDEEYREALEIANHVYEWASNITER